MNINTHTLSPGNVSVLRERLKKGNVSSNTVNYTNYDDTKIKERLSILETEVSEIQYEDEGFQRRLSALESIDYSEFATKEEVGVIEERVTVLETTPVGLNDDQMDEIFD